MDGDGCKESEETEGQEGIQSGQIWICLFFKRVKGNYLEFAFFINQVFRTEQRGRKKNVDVFLGKGFHHCSVSFQTAKSLKYLALWWM